MGKKNVIITLVAIAVFILVVTSIVLIVISLKKLDSNEVGIAYDTYQMKLSDTVEGEGLYNGPPGFIFIRFPSVYKTMTFPNLSCLNKDMVDIELDASFQFKVRQASIRDLILQFRNFSGLWEILQYTGLAAFHEACSLFNTSQVQAERGAFQETALKKLRERYDILKCDITDLQVNNIQRPLEYEAAVRSKERARENIQVAMRERPRLLTQAATLKREAETQAEIIVDKAMSEARILENKAAAEAMSIQRQYEKESEAYETVLTSKGLGFTPQGFISYMGIRVISSAKNPVFIGLQSPAKSSYNQN